MDRIVINVHSMVDLITNSSTELFVLDTEKSLDAIKEILEKAIELENASSGGDLKFSDVFNEPKIGSGKEALGYWVDHYSSNIKEGVILEGVDDNSIPYWMFDFIENTFGYSTERFHLG